MTTQPTAVPDHHVREGADYWASWGSKGWTSVRVIQVKRKWAQVDRVDPRTNLTKKRKAKVRLDELVRRDPKLTGGDKPEVSPSVIFESVRSLREEAEKVETTPVVDAYVEKVPSERDSWGGEQWLALHRKVWDKVNGAGHFDSFESDFA